MGPGRRPAAGWVLTASRRAANRAQNSRTTSEPAQAANSSAQQGFTYLRRRNVGLVSAGSATYGAVRTGESWLNSVAALAQGDSGEQGGSCEQRG